MGGDGPDRAGHETRAFSRVLRIASGSRPKNMDRMSLQLNRSLMLRVIQETGFH